MNNNKKIKNLKHKKNLPYSIDSVFIINFKKRNCLNKNFTLKDLFSSQQKKETIKIFRAYCILHSKLTNRAIFKKDEIKKNFKFLMIISNFRFFRHKKRRPVRGQRTRTNAKTQRKKSRLIYEKKRKIKYKY